MTKRKQTKTKANTLDQQIDDATIQLVETMMQRIENLGMCKFTRNYLAWEIHIEAESAHLDDKQQLAMIKREQTRLNSMTDTEFESEFGGIVTLEFIKELKQEEIKDVFFYIMHNIEDWVK